MCCLAPLALTQVSGPAKKKVKRPAPPAVTPAQRAAAQGRVDGYLEASAEFPFEQPTALAPFFEQLFKQNPKPETPAPIHILHFGDSHTAADEWTGGLRDLFKEKFGDGGAGFSLAGHPFLGYRRFDARGGGTTLWRSEGLRAGKGDGYFGLGGVSIATERAAQSVFLNAGCDHLEVHYLQQPGGGDLALYDGDVRIGTISTDGELGPGAVRYDTPPGLHHFKLVTLRSRPVRLFGWVTDEDAGVTYEALGINGAEAGVMLRWNENMLATYLQRRSPGLIVLAYGTNEASDPNWDAVAYQAMFAELLQRLHRAAPAAALLALGPDDRWWRIRSQWRLVEGVDDVIQAQRKACLANACAYWDLRERMGGKGSIPDWITAGLAQPDHVHFTVAGYRRLASVLFQDIMRQYEMFKKARQEMTDHGQSKQDR
ncbi:conserved hypothetical protein [Candidatus Sulfopaludibacter sp. SbA3]|nr:conserved hypothetical protein [Candidatus Sulfopaludibacter sp. SbA3]